MSNGKRKLQRHSSSAGFSLLETFIATQLLLIGMVGVLSLSALSLTSVHLSDNESIARQKARQVLEGIYTAKNTQLIGFSQIRNSSNGGIFLDGFQPLQTAGSDGIFGTLDDDEIEVAQLPGDDHLLGTADDEIRPLDYLQRRVLIGEVSSQLRKISITIRYTTPQGFQRDYLLEAMMSAFR